MDGSYKLPVLCRLVGFRQKQLCTVTPNHRSPTPPTANSGPKSRQRAYSPSASAGPLHGSHGICTKHNPAPDTHSIGQDQPHWCHHTPTRNACPRPDDAIPALKAPGASVYTRNAHGSGGTTHLHTFIRHTPHMHTATRSPWPRLHNSLLARRGATRTYYNTPRIPQTVLTIPGPVLRCAHSRCTPRPGAPPCKPTSSQATPVASRKQPPLAQQSASHEPTALGVTMQHRKRPAKLEPPTPLLGT